MSPADRFLSCLTWSKKTGPGRWIARCPAHKDRSPSLSISEKEDSTLLIYCHGGCAVDDVVGAVGLDLADLFPPRATNDFKPRDKSAFHAADILASLADELTFAAVVMCDLRQWLVDGTKGQPPGPDTRARFMTAASRIRAGAELATGRHVDVADERREIIAAGILTEAEEIQLREFANA